MSTVAENSRVRWPLMLCYYRGPNRATCSVFVLLDEYCDKNIHCLSCLMIRMTSLCMVIELFTLCYVYIRLYTITEYLHRVCSLHFELGQDRIITGM